MVHNERTMHAWDDLWLDKGTYFVNVEYINKITIRDMPPNS